MARPVGFEPTTYGLEDVDYYLTHCNIISFSALAPRLCHYVSLHDSAFRYGSSMHDTSVTQRMHSHAAWHSYAFSPLHHRAVVELARARIVDGVRDHPKHWPRSIRYLILRR